MKLPTNSTPVLAWYLNTELETAFPIVAACIDGVWMEATSETIIDEKVVAWEPILPKAGESMDYAEIVEYCAKGMESFYFVRNDLEELGTPGKHELPPQSREACIVALNALVYEAQELARCLVECR